MKINSSFLTALFGLMMLWTPLPATQLDGLWKNNRQNITVRIAQDEDGIRAKRIDQGIWYKYVASDENTFVDKQGNAYDWVSTNKMVWTEGSSSKRISFYRVDENGNSSESWNDNPRNTDRRDDDGNWDNDRDNDRWNKDRNSGNYRNEIEGRWVDRQHRQYIDVKPFKGGYMVKSRNEGYNKFYADRSGSRYKDDRGNILRVLDRDTIQIRTHQGRDMRTFTRNAERNSNKNRDNNRDKECHDHR
ncbi:MAG: hypothetical protein M3R25_04840 [Bacteroidota bacterium]|nr:hypothetical protein [Bacteroidota bacterium]